MGDCRLDNYAAHNDLINEILMELAISVITGFMIIGALYAIHAKDILSAVIACGIVGYSLVICFLLLKAPDLAIVQIVVEINYTYNNGCSGS